MGFEELVSELSRNADAEGKKHLRAAEKNSEKIVEEAHEKADTIVKAAKKEATDLSKQESSERITSAKMSAKKMLDEARDEAVEKSLVQVWQKFKSSALGKSTYPALLNRLAREGMDEIGSEERPTLYIRDEDRPLVSGFSTKKLPPEYSGGVIVESANGRVRVNKTLEELFAQRKMQLRKQAYDKLF